MSFSLVQFIEAVDSYFKYSTETAFTTVQQFISLFRNNNTVLGCLANELWQPSTLVTAGMIKQSPNMTPGLRAKALSTGTTSATEPTWPTTSGNQVTDGGVAWIVIPQTGQELATQAEVTAGTVADKVITPATAAGCYLRIWQGTTEPTDLSGRTAWLNTNTDPAALYYYNVSKSAWQSAVAYAAGAGTAANANYVNNKTPLFELPVTALLCNIEFNKGPAGTGGFIDFHYNNSSADYTSRIIEYTSGQITLDAPNGVQLSSGVILK